MCEGCNLCDGLLQMDPGRRGTRRRGRLVRSERVVETHHPQFTAWDVFIRDSLMQIAWPISLSSDNEAADAFVKNRQVHIDSYLYFLYITFLSLVPSGAASFQVQCIFGYKRDIRLPLKIEFHHSAIYDFLFFYCCIVPN